MPSPKLRAPAQRGPLALTPEEELDARLDPQSPHRATLAAVDAEFGVQRTGAMAGRPDLHALTIRLALREEHHATARGPLAPEGRADAHRRAVGLMEQAQDGRR